ncbi:cytochrome C [Ramlibacter sp. WS9]|uniref:cytochrome C n=1 Tax=Ramlibacter sp. WS9 TaxID=1882741 RepID=UPI0018EE8351|nr:cytochrome C [Ramlibacter sp. WS9]
MNSAPAMSKSKRAVLLVTALACSTAAQAQPATSPTRGELLYNNHCIECHTTQMHWRERRQARDWPSLRAQVERWQAAAGLQWSEADITEVARHLDNTIYRFTPDTERVGSATAP